MQSGGICAAIPCYVILRFHGEGRSTQTGGLTCGVTHICVSAVHNCLQGTGFSPGAAVRSIDLKKEALIFVLLIFSVAAFHYTICSFQYSQSGSPVSV